MLRQHKDVCKTEVQLKYGTPWWNNIIVFFKYSTKLNDEWIYMPILLFIYNLLSGFCDWIGSKRTNAPHKRATVFSMKLETMP